MPTTEKQTCLRVGVTGGIGSGKSTVCRIFETLGIPVYDADYWAKWLILHDPAVKSEIISVFGAEAYLPDGAYNRTYIASIVFSDPSRLALLNAAVHPALENHSRAWHEAEAAKGALYTIKEAAILVEVGSHRFLDALIVVTAPENLRIQRVVARDGVDEALVRARIRAQTTDEEKLAVADYVIVNDGLRALIPQIWDIHRAILEKRGTEE